MAYPRSTTRPLPAMGWAVVLIICAVIGLSLWANLSALVTDPLNYRFFPPFMPRVNRNHNEHLGAEYYNIAGALGAGRGYADPFRDPTGPTAWMAPVLPIILAALRWLTQNDREAIVGLFVLLQDLTLIGTGILILALVRRTTGQVKLAAVVFVIALTYYFRLSFQFTHDCWLVLAALDGLLFGLIWLRPLAGTWKLAAGWGAFGGLCALIGPVVGFTWAVLTVGHGWPKPQRRQLLIAAVVSMLTIAPWVIRNYLVFGRFIPVKSNLAYELYQSQVLQPGGVLKDGIFGSHPYVSNNEERRLYKKMGEIEFLDQKSALFRQAVRANPADFVERVANRFFAATLLYTSFNTLEDSRRPVTLWLSRLLFPLPFLALMVLVFANFWRPLSSAQWITIGIYLSFLMPYVVVSYYERYKYPLMGVEVLLVVWGCQKIGAFMRGRPAAHVQKTEVLCSAGEESSTLPEEAPHEECSVPQS